MAEIHLGDKFKFLRHEIELRSIGRVTVLRGRGVVVGIGTAIRGPVMEPFGLMKPSQVRAIYGEGPLADDLETALNQGCSVAYGVRVLGSRCIAASLDLNYGSKSTKCGIVAAKGDGVWGNMLSVEIVAGNFTKTKIEYLKGDGTKFKFDLEFDDIRYTPSTDNEVTYVSVGGTKKTIVTSGTPIKGQVLLDTTAGTLEFVNDPAEKPKANETFVCQYRYKARTVKVYETGAPRPIVYENVTSLEMLAAKISTDPWLTFKPEPGVTRLPAVITRTSLAGGIDGTAIGLDDWKKAFNIVLEKMPAEVIPTTVFTAAHSVSSGSMDIIPLMDAFLWESATRLKPCLGFVPMDITKNTQELSDFANGFSNLWMTLIGNAYSETERNLAPARAGMEAALPLGTSAATNSNSLKGVDGLLKQFSEVDREVLTYGQVDVLVKDRGIHPYVGITTDTDTNFKRCVDVRTIAECIVLADGVVKKFLNERRTQTNLSRLKASITLLYDILLNKSILDDFSVDVKPNYSDRNAVDIHIMLQPVGHMERFYTVMDVGYWSDKLAI